MRRMLPVVLLLGLATAVAAISSEPVYIKGYEGASTVLGSVKAVQDLIPTLKLDPPSLQLMKELKPILEKLGEKAKSFKDKPVEVTPEYQGIDSVVKRIKLGREHVLLQKLDELVKAVETASK